MEYVHALINVCLRMEYGFGALVIHDKRYKWLSGKSELIKTTNCDTAGNCKCFYGLERNSSRSKSNRTIRPSAPIFCVPVSSRPNHRCRGPHREVRPNRPRQPHWPKCEALLRTFRNFFLGTLAIRNQNSRPVSQLQILAEFTETLSRLASFGTEEGGRWQRDSDPLCMRPNIPFQELSISRHYDTFFDPKPSIVLR